MAECDACGKDSDRMLYTCNHCGKNVCSDCRLPENHFCGVRDRVDQDRKWRRGTVGSSPVEGEDARADCKTDDCSNVSEPDSKFCASCLNKADREDSDSNRRKFGETECASLTCSNVAGHNREYCFDCRRDNANSSSSPGVSLKSTSSSPTARSGVARVRSGASTALEYVLCPFGLLLKVVLTIVDAATSKTGVAVLLIVALALAAGPLGLVSLNPDQIAGAVENVTEDEQVSDTQTTAGQTGEWNHELIERYFIMFLNQERSSRGLQNVSERAVLAKMGESHSQNMIRHDYFDHVQPDGTTAEDRYRERGLLPECELPTKEGGYYAGAENLAKTHVNTNVVMDNGSTVYITSERELAKQLFLQWMNSKGHREAMLVYSADEAGLGLAFDDDTVYASLELC